jgi:hypothetical protein
MTFMEFHNGLRVLINIDKPEFDMALGPLVSQSMWESFRDNPWRWFIKAPDRQAEAVFKVIEARNAGIRQREASTDLTETLHACEEYFDQRMDTEDGPNGGVYPNAEMSLLTDVQAAIAKLEKEAA